MTDATGAWGASRAGAARRPPATRTLALLAQLAVAAAASSSDVSVAEPLALGRSGDATLELRGFLKVQGVVARMQPGLVESVGELARVVEAARAALPAPQAVSLPTMSALPSGGGLGSALGRVAARLQLGERVELAAGWQVGMLTATSGVLLGGGALGTTVGGAAQARAKRRLVAFDSTLVTGGASRLQHDLDLLSLKVHTEAADVVVGRQVLSWGSGRLWSPTDLLSPFAPTDLDREVRRGVDAVRLSVKLAATAQLEALWLPQLDARDMGGALRATFNVAGVDVAPSVAKYARDLVGGLDVAGDLGPLGAHAEAAYTWALEASASGARERFLRLVTGLDWRPVDEVALSLEYHFNGYGAASPSGYARVLASPRVQRGELFGAGRHALGVVASCRASELTTLQAVALSNLGDPSVLIVPAVEHWAEQSVLVRLSASIPVGRPPSAAALRQLGAADLLGQTDAWRRGSESLGLRSEHGAAPWSFALQVAVYFG